MSRSIRLMLLLFVICLPAQLCAAKGGDWVFFDLGKTIIDFEEDFASIRYMPGAHEYLETLKSRGFRLGLLVNWPEDEGKSNAEKLALLKKFVAPKWVDPVPPDWSLFDAVLFPPKDIYRKPHPYLFIEALRLAAPYAVIYQGEDPGEIEAARRLGLVTNCPSDGKGGHVPLVPADSIKALIRDRFIYETPAGRRN